MIKCINIKRERDSEAPFDVIASLVSDTSTEVEAIGNDGTEVVGLGFRYEMTLGSTCLSADGKFGMLDSEGTWHFA